MERYWDDFYKYVHWDNIPNLKHPEPENDFVKFWEAILAVINKKTPVMVYFHNNTIRDLENLFHPIETIECLNNSGLDIYLYEPLVSYIEGESSNNVVTMFYHEFDGTENLTKLRAKELDSILIYATNNNLSNITVRLCDYDPEKYYTYYSHYMKLINDNLFINTFFDSLPLAPNNLVVPSKKFICLNWRYTKHRHLMAAFLADKKNINLSWYFSESLTISDLYFDFESWKNSDPDIYYTILNGDRILQENAPVCLDIITDRANALDETFLPYNNNVFEQSQLHTEKKQLYHFFQDSFCAIVTESRFAQPTGDFSEKTYLPINFKKPFILVAPPKTLEYIKSQGFKTFDEFWDESYDNECNHGKRLLKIFRVIDTIYNMSNSELLQLQSDIKPIVEHNFKILNQKRALKSHKIAMRMYKKKPA